MSELPLIEYTSDGSAIKETYTVNGVLKEEYAFQESFGDALRPRLADYTPGNGLSSCYYYQQEMGADNKPMKSKACVMLAMGLEDSDKNKYIGIVNFSATASGRLSRITTDTVDLPDINVQAMDENPYETLEEIPIVNRGVAWQEPQKMRLLDIDPNGLSTSGGVLKFAYTSASIGISQGYSDAVGATDPYLFDDSLGRVNLYFKGERDNFFVLYFNPTGRKSVKATYNPDPSSPVALTMPLSVKPRLDRDMDIDVGITVAKSSNTCTLEMRSTDAEVEKWEHLPKRLKQMADILNGNGELPLGTLAPLGDTEDPKRAYKKGNTNVNIRTMVDNKLIFKTKDAYDSELFNGKEHTISLSDLSPYLANNTTLYMAGKEFSLIETEAVTVKADVFHKAYLSGLVNDAEDITKIWEDLLSKGLIAEIAERPERGNLGVASMDGTKKSLGAVLTDESIDSLSLQWLQEGKEADKKARRAGLKQSLIALILDVADVRILTFKVQDKNIQSVERLEAGLAVNVAYDYAAHFTCTPANLGGISAPAWEHFRSYLCTIEAEQDTEVLITFGFNVYINNTIGHWEDWEASLALDFDPSSAANGALLHTSNAEKLAALQPTEKGLSLEAWAKPSAMLNGPGSIVYYKQNDQHYSLGIEKDSADAHTYKCIATLGNKKYTSKKAFAFQNDRGKEPWRHLAFSHKKYWGYQLDSADTINCGSDDSLHLNDEFTLEALVKIDTPGTLLEKEGEYRLSISTSNKAIFTWGDNSVNLLEGAPSIAIGNFYKITVIRSKRKPQTIPSSTEYPLTGDQAEGNEGKKWYEGEDIDTEKLLKGLAEKQDQMESDMDFSLADTFNMGNDQGSDSNPAYYHTVVVTGNNDEKELEWTTEQGETMDTVEAYRNFVMGGNNFSGIFSKVRIWNRALSIGEAEKLAMPENKTGLRAHWRMAEGKGNYLYDDVSANHGVVNGGTWIDSPQTRQQGQFQLYVDGTPEPYDTSTDNVTPGVDQFSIGGYKTAAGTTDHFKGALEEIRVWNVSRSNEQITDNVYGRLKGEWEQLLANYTFDRPIQDTHGQVQDASANSTHLTVEKGGRLKEVLSTAPVATEIPQVRSALTGVLTDHNGTLYSRPGVVEYGDLQKNDDGTFNGILKRCYSFIDAAGTWNRMTGYKVGNLVSQWYGQAQFAPQVMGYLEGSPPVPAENFPLGNDNVLAKADIDTFAYRLNNSIRFNQAEEVSYNYSTSKEAGWNVTAESEGKAGLEISFLIAPFGFGLSQKAKFSVAGETNWETSGNRSESYEKGVAVNTNRILSATLAGYDNNKAGGDRYYKLGNTGYALVKSKTADIYLLRLAHNDALVSISWQPNPDIPEDVNILPFPINPLYTKQGTLDGKFGDTTDDHYPQAQGAYGEYSYFKPRQAYQLKKQIEREKQELREYFRQFAVVDTSGRMKAAIAVTSIQQLVNILPVQGPLMNSVLNQTLGQVATQLTYNNTQLQEELSRKMSSRNLINNYVWTIEGGFYEESTEITETQQETYSGDIDLSLGGTLGVSLDVSKWMKIEFEALFGSGSSLTMTKSKTKEASSSFGLEVSVDLPTSPRYRYGGVDGRALTKGLIGAGTVDAYRFMSFYLEPKAKNFTDLFTEVIDPIWLDESPDPSAQALRQARGNIDKAKPCWRIMHRVTYVSRILPEFTPETPPSLEKSLRVAGFESNYMLIKRFEPYVTGISDSETFFTKIEEIIDTQLPEFTFYKRQIKEYLALYFNIGLV